MKNFINLGLIYLIAIGLSFSCTMQKRVYMKGYNVEWFSTKHKSHKIEPLDELKGEHAVRIEPVEIGLFSSESYGENNTAVAYVSDVQLMESQQKSNSLVVTTTSKDLFIKRHFENNSGTNKDLIINEIKSNEDPKKGLGVFSALSFVFGLIALGLAFVPFGEFLIPAIILILLFALLAVIFAAIVMRNKYHYKGVGFAITGYILGILALLIGALALVAFAFLL